MRARKHAALVFCATLVLSGVPALGHASPDGLAGDDRYPNLSGSAKSSKPAKVRRAKRVEFAPSLTTSPILAEARRYIGTNPTGMNRLWCARFMNLVLERSGYRGTGSNLARSFASYGRRISGPQVGAIAVMSRGRNGGHVGVVSGIDESGNPIIISGNHNRSVAEAPYPRSRIYAYVMPM